MAVTTEQVNQLYGQLLGRSGADQYLQNWAQSGMSIDQIAADIAASPEGRQYAAQQPPPPVQQTTYAAPATTEPVPTANPVSGQQAPLTQAVTPRDVNAIYEELLGRSGADSYIQQWVDSGGSLEEIRAGIAGSPEGQAYAASQTTSANQNNSNQAVLDAINAQQAAQAESFASQQETYNAQLAEQEARYAEQQASYQSQQEALMSQLAAQREAQQNMLSTYGQSAKGGTGQQPPPVMDQTPTPQPTQQPAQADAGYYRNPYSSGYGMGYQDPYASQQYMPQRGLMGPSGFGGYSPYGGGKGGYRPQPSPSFMGKGGPRPMASSPASPPAMAPSTAPATDPAMAASAVEPPMPTPTSEGTAAPQTAPYSTMMGKGGYPVQSFSNQQQAPTKGGYRPQQMPQQMYQPRYQPMYQPRGGYYGGGYYG